MRDSRGLPPTTFSRTNRSVASRPPRELLRNARRGIRRQPRKLPPELRRNGSRKCLKRPVAKPEARQWQIVIRDVAAPRLAARKPELDEPVAVPADHRTTDTPPALVSSGNFEAAAARSREPLQDPGPAGRPAGRTAAERDHPRRRSRQGETPDASSSPSPRAAFRATNLSSAVTVRF